MRYVRLQVREDVSLGGLGLTVKSMRMIDTPMVASEGLLIAHDLLEHQNGVKSIGSIDDELEALGGMWYVRGQFGPVRRGAPYTPIDSLSADIQNLGEIYVGRHVDFRTQIPRTKCLDNCDLEFKEAIHHGVRMMRDELAYQDELIDERRVREYKQACIHYLRTGYRKAYNRYRNPHKANAMFWNIADAVEGVMGYAEYEGQEFVLAYDKTRAYCEEKYEPEYYF